MQPSNVGSLSLNSQASYTDATAAVLPKIGEVAPNALLAPVEEVKYSASPSAIRQEPVVYEKPKSAVQAKQDQPQPEDRESQSPKETQDSSESKQTAQKVESNQEAR